MGDITARRENMISISKARSIETTKNSNYNIKRSKFWSQFFIDQTRCNNQMYYNMDHNHLVLLESTTDLLSVFTFL